MSRQAPEKEQRIPLGLGLMGIGAVVLLFVFFGWVAWSTVYAPDSLPPVLHAIPTRMAAAGIAVPVPDGAAPSSAAGDVAPVLLPESPVDSAAAPRYPSHATVAELARQDPAPVPGQPLQIAIPRIGVDAPVSAVGLEQVVIGGERFYQWSVPPRHEGGWHTGSALLGEAGNTVINGHNNTLGAVFRDLIQLEAGDEVTVDDGQASYLYVVEQVLTLPEQGQPTAVRVENARWIEPTADERLTLVSCWPYETNTHRLVVVARRATTPAQDN